MGLDLGDGQSLQFGTINFIVSRKGNQFDRGGRG